jgi:methylthioribose-1-phosphate isomerase
VSQRAGQEGAVQTVWWEPDAVCLIDQTRLPHTRAVVRCSTVAEVAAAIGVTAGYGTALAPIRTAHDRGENLHVLVDEIRPFLQGSRLTAWELQQAGVPLTLITDNMAGYFMQRGEVDCIIVGADRIVANGDVASKIGTYGLAVLAQAHATPFYVAAPTSTIDMHLESGDDIPIEQRYPREVTHLAGRILAPRGVRAAHPAFDVTPHALISAIITERGIVEPPFEANLRRILKDRPTPPDPSKSGGHARAGS